MGSGAACESQPGMRRAESLESRQSQCVLPQGLPLLGSVLLFLYNLILAGCYALFHQRNVPVLLPLRAGTLVLC
jgi:hypothetical protein